MQRMPILSETDMTLFELKTRYVRNYLTFAGKNSKDYLLYISGPGVYNSPATDMELQAIPGRNGDMIRDNARYGERRFKNVDISYDAFFFDGLAPRTAAVKSWLLSPAGYQVLHDQQQVYERLSQVLQSEGLLAIFRYRRRARSLQGV